MAALLKNLLAGFGGPSRPNPITTGTSYGGRPSLLGGVNPTPPMPGYNPMGKKKPQSATPIPGMTGYGSGTAAPATGRNTLLGR